MSTERMKCFLAQCFAAGMKQLRANPKEKSEGNGCCPRIRVGVQRVGGKGREGVGKFPTTHCDSPRCWQGSVEPGVCRQLLPVPRFSSSVGAT